jgi:hypothetical protein
MCKESYLQVDVYIHMSCERRNVLARNVMQQRILKILPRWPLHPTRCLSSKCRISHLSILLNLASAYPSMLHHHSPALSVPDELEVTMLSKRLSVRAGPFHKGKALSKSCSKPLRHYGILPHHQSSCIVVLLLRWHIPAAFSFFP